MSIEFLSEDEKEDMFTVTNQLSKILDSSEPDSILEGESVESLSNKISEFIKALN